MMVKDVDEGMCEHVCFVSECASVGDGGREGVFMFVCLCLCILLYV